MYLQKAFRSFLQKPVAFVTERPWDWGTTTKLNSKRFDYYDLIQFAGGAQVPAPIYFGRRNTEFQRTFKWQIESRVQAFLYGVNRALYAHQTVEVIDGFVEDPESYMTYADKAFAYLTANPGNLSGWYPIAIQMEGFERFATEKADPDCLMHVVIYSDGSRLEYHEVENCWITVD